LKILSNSLLKYSGIDRAVFYTIIQRTWSIIAGLLTLVMIAYYLSAEEQGFYYTFASVLALQVFFELGLTSVILSFASHEMGDLKWINGKLEGNTHSKARLASLLCFIIKWYRIITILFFLVLLLGGIFFFERIEQNVEWKIPWIWLVFSTACVLFITPFFSLIEGCGLVAEVALIRTLQSVAGFTLLWFGLYQEAGLLAVSFLSMTKFIIGVSWLILKYRNFFLNLILTYSNTSAVISWKQEIWPLQWKIALSWLSGYFIFHLFNPVMLAYYGPVAAGQMGMSLSIVSALSTVSIIWISTKAPIFGKLIAQRKFTELDKIFFHNLWISFSVSIVGAITLLGLVYFLQTINHPVSHRILDFSSFTVLIINATVSNIVFAEAIYLRAHKQEPFLITSIIMGFLICLSTLFIGKNYGAFGIVMGYFMINLFIGLGLGTKIFYKKRRLWHT